MFKSLYELVKKRIRDYSFSDEILAAKVLSLWQQIIEEEFGLQISREARALYFKEGVLKVKVLNSSLLQELKLKELKTIQRINLFLDRNFIKSQKLKKIIYTLSN